jgi:hypothetical protein
MGFLLSSLGLLVLFITIKIFGLVLLSPLPIPTLSAIQTQLACHSCMSCCAASPHL